MMIIMELVEKTILRPTLFFASRSLSIFVNWEAAKIMILIDGETAQEPKQTQPWEKIRPNKWPLKSFLITQHESQQIRVIFSQPSCITVNHGSTASALESQ